MTKQKTILITGATSGIGKALAEAYATSGVTLYLTGRNRERLDEVANICRYKGATVDASAMNVTQTGSIERQILSWEAQSPIDIVIANAGISEGSNQSAEEADQNLRQITETNLVGTFNTVNPLIPFMQKRKTGHIVLMSSMAGFRGLPNAPAYSTSKVAVRAYGDALRPLLKPDGITVSIIFPGFVKTPLTDVNKFQMPFLMEAEKAAQIIKDGIEKKKPFIAFPWQMHVICQLIGLLPRRLGDYILSKAPKKG